MMQAYTSKKLNIAHLCVSSSSIMSEAKIAEWHFFSCLQKTGSSGCLEPGAALHILV